MKPTILLVDDEPTTVGALKIFLEKRGFEVKIAENATSGFVTFAKFHPCVVISDLHMPGGLSGIELLKSIRNNSTDFVPGLVLHFAGKLLKCYEQIADLVFIKTEYDHKKFFEKMIDFATKKSLEQNKIKIMHKQIICA